MTHNAIKRRGQRRRFIDLGHDAARQILAGVGAHHVVQRVAATAGVQQQQAIDLARAHQHRCLLSHHAVALTHADRVDQHHVLVAQIGQRAPQVLAVAHNEHGHAENAAIDAQLLLRPDPVAVGGQQRQTIGAIAHHAARCQLCRGGGLAHTGRPDNGIHAATVDEVRFRRQGAQTAIDSRLQPLASVIQIHVLGHVLYQASRKLAGKPGFDHFTKKQGTDRRVARHFTPGKAGQLALKEALDDAHFIPQFRHRGRRLPSVLQRLLCRRTLRARDLRNGRYIPFGRTPWRQGPQAGSALLRRGGRSGLVRCPGTHHRRLARSRRQGHGVVVILCSWLLRRWRGTS